VPQALIAVLAHAGSVAHSHRQTETDASLGQRLIHLSDKCRPTVQGRACDVLPTYESQIGQEALDVVAVALLVRNGRAQGSLLGGERYTRFST
jgi:hypothetical protein